MEPCSICGGQTEMCCADCYIDERKTVHVCVKTACRDEHEAVRCTSVHNADGTVTLRKEQPEN